MSMSNSLENALLLLLFNATTFANVAVNATSSPVTDVHVALSTDLSGATGETAAMNTNEVTYTSYARVAVVRTSSGWTVTNNSVSPAAQISFPAGTGGSGTASHFNVGTGSSGAGVSWFNGSITPTIATGNGVTPILTTATAISLD